MAVRATGANLNDIAIFMTVVDAGTIAGAARMCGLTRSAAGKAVARLEDRLGVRLLNRTTRALSLTDEGQSFYASSLRIFDAVDEAESSVAGSRSVPKGALRLSAPHAFGQRLIMPVIEEFLVRWPETRIEASFTDRMVDLLDEGFDLAIRFGGVAPDSRMVSRIIGRDRYVLVASAHYVAQHGRLRSLDDLANHPCLVFSNRDHRQRWRFTGSDGQWTIPSVQSRLRLDSGEALCNAVARNLGIALMPTFLVSEQIQAGQFVHLLPDVKTDEVEIRVIYTDRRLLNPRVRRFIDLLASNVKFGWQVGAD